MFALKSSTLVSLIGVVMTVSLSVYAIPLDVTHGTELAKRNDGLETESHPLEDLAWLKFTERVDNEIYAPEDLAWLKREQGATPDAAIYPPEDLQWL